MDRAESRNNRPWFAVLQVWHPKWMVEMDIIDMARASGLTVILDGRIGREEYQSVCGSVSALQRFAESLRQCEADVHEHESIRCGQRRAARLSGSVRLRKRVKRFASVAGATTTLAQRTRSGLEQADANVACGPALNGAVPSGK